MWYTIKLDESCDPPYEKQGHRGYVLFTNDRSKWEMN